MALREDFEQALRDYPDARTSGSFNAQHPVYQLFARLADELRELEIVRHRPTLRVKMSVGQGNWASIPWIAFLDNRETGTTQNGVYPVFLFRHDMSGVYVTFNQGVTVLKEKHGTKEARRILRSNAQRLRSYCEDAGTAGFHLDDNVSITQEPGLGNNYEASTVAYKYYERGAVPVDSEIYSDIELMLKAYDRYLEDKEQKGTRMATTREETQPTPPVTSLSSAVAELVRYISEQGFVFEPWQIAQYVTAIRTKPFVILAGISGTGKSRLPALVAQATGGVCRLVPVRPDWTDSSDVLGYTNLQGDFRPGAVLEIAQDATANSDSSWTCILDEMNLARVEQYFAEVLSRIEARHPSEGGGYASESLLGQKLGKDDAEWTEVALPPNLVLVGTVNMDESTHGFSRKVLDRAFTIEISDVVLEQWKESGQGSDPKRQPATWPVSFFYPRATRLAELSDLTVDELTEIERSITALVRVNELLAPAQLQVGYRTRDEVALFTLHALEIREAFVGRDGTLVDPLDLALQMKVLPRIVGGSGAIKLTLLGLLGWSTSNSKFKTDEDARAVFDVWQTAGRPSTLADSLYPRLSARLCLMWERLQTEGYTSYWL